MAALGIQSKKVEIQSRDLMLTMASRLPSAATGSKSLQTGGRATARVVATSPSAGVSVSLGARLLAAPGTICRQSLNNTIPGQHATVDGEVPAHHEGFHGCILLG